MSTFIDGIGASENIDSSGERISIAGMDISSLPVDGVFTWEHELAKDAEGNQISIKTPAQVVGKILKARKIFSEKDVTDEREAYFWDKCRTPFLYVMGELFDDYKESAKDIAGMFRYDQDKKGQNEKNVMNFSIEGAKIAKQGIDITNSIARKCTITVLPANKAAIAEMVPANNGKQKDDLDNLFKTENSVEIEMFKVEDVGKLMKSLKKSEYDKGTHIGTTKSGKDVHSHGRIPDYAGFSSQDHQDASNLHYNAIKEGADPKTVQHHMGKLKLHMQAQQSAERRENRMKTGLVPTAKPPMAQGAGASMPKIHTSVARPYGQVANKNLNKSLTAGSSNVAPSQLTGGAALTPESLDKKMHKSSEKVPHKHIGWNKLHSKIEKEGYSKESADKIAGAIKAKVHPMKKNEIWIERAQEEYKQWDKREDFVRFMAEKMPNLTKTEIDVIGQTFVLKKSIEAEKELVSLSGLDQEPKIFEIPLMKGVLKFGDGNSVSPKEDATPAKLPEKYHNYKAEVKGHFDSEVEHVHPHYDGKSPDTVYLKSGHKLEGHEKGKYKAGDKVSVKQHMMGTHVMEHKKDQKTNK